MIESKYCRSHVCGYVPDYVCMFQVDGPVAWKLQKVVMVLMMTLPGTPVIRYGDEISQAPVSTKP